MANLKIFNLNLLYILLIIVTIYFTYSSMLNNYFFLDDFVNIHRGLENTFKIKENPLHILKIFTDSKLSPGDYYRPLTVFYLILTYNLFGLNPVGYNIFNLLIHIINALLLYFLVILLVKNKHLAFISAVFFGITSVYYSIVSAVYQLGILLSVMLCLLTLILFIYYLNKGKKYFYYLSLLFFIAAYLIHEASVILISILLLYYFLFYVKNISLHSLKEYKTLVPFFIFSFVYIFLRLFVIKMPLYVYMGQIKLDFYILTNLLKYLTIFIISFKLSNNFPYILNILFFNAAEINLNLIILIPILLISLFILIKGSKNTKFFLLWIYITLIPFIIFLGIDRCYLYPASIGFSVLLAFLLLFFYNIIKKISKIIAIIVVFILFIFISNIFIEATLQNTNQFSKLYQREWKELIVEDVNAYNFPPNSSLFFKCRASIPQTFLMNLIDTETNKTDLNVYCMNDIPDEERTMNNTFYNRIDYRTFYTLNTNERELVSKPRNITTLKNIYISKCTIYQCTYTENVTKIFPLNEMTIKFGYP